MTATGIPEAANANLKVYIKADTTDVFVLLNDLAEAHALGKGHLVTALAAMSEAFFEIDGSQREEYGFTVVTVHLRPSPALIELHAAVQALVERGQ